MDSVKLVTTSCSKYVGSPDAVHLGRWCIEGIADSGSFRFVDEEEVSVSKKISVSSEVQVIVERILPDVVSGLNHYHGLQKSSRYWRIILGRWLYGFSDVVYQRVKLLERALNSYSISESDGVHASASELVADCTQDYLRQLTSQSWNSALFRQLLESLEIQCQKLDYRSGWKGENEKPLRGPHMPHPKRTLYGLGVAKSQIAIADPYLSRLPQLLLTMRTLSMPIRVQRVPIRSDKFDLSGRLKIMPFTNSDDSVECLIRELLPLHLPRSVIEHFSLLNSELAWVNYPKNPKVIFTANAHHSSDDFVIWAAEQVERGTPFVLSQHGGLYGESRIRSRHEEHEVSVADRYLTWGWDDGKHNTVVTIPSLTGIGMRRRKSNPRKQSDIVIVADATLRFSRYAWDISRDRTEYISRVKTISRELSSRFDNRVVLRLHHAHQVFDAADHYFEPTFKGLRIDNGTSKLSKVLSTAGLTIITTLGSTFGENVFRDIPTIICIDPVMYPERDEFRPLFVNLRKVGVMFNDPIAMCTFVEEMWPNVVDWWKSTSVQNAVLNYQANFFKKSGAPILKLARALAM